jgi:hypothetical protein
MGDRNTGPGFAYVNAITCHVIPKSNAVYDGACQISRF